MPDEPSWLRLDALLDAALALAPGKRRSFLDEECAGDTLLRRRIDELLDVAEHEDAGLQPGGGLQGALAQEVLDELGSDAVDALLAPGTVLGRFELRGLLGKGGMGRVYRAHDPRLGRELAIKALAGTFRDDPAALRRFEREARVLATINHPNVAAIHGFELIDGAPYLVLELVEGETLEERLERGRLPWPTALAIAVQIAEALEEAHRKDVVHRDLKPANVKFTPEGRVKVLDFGLARTLSAGPAPASGLEASSPTTGPGAILGTAPYMSPEQAQGRPVDGRGDIWALGCVLYEMLSGQRAFRGRTTADVLAAVARDEVDWSALPADVPPSLSAVLERCLRKELRERFQDAGDLRAALAELAARAQAPPVAPSISVGRRVATVLPWLIAAASLAALLVEAPWRGSAPLPATRMLQVALRTPTGIELFEDYAAPFALSPDGSTVAFLGREAGAVQLFVRHLDRMETQSLPGTEGASQPFFSPDGRWLAFFAGRKLKKVALAGGRPLTLVELGLSPRGGTWGTDGDMIVTPSQTSGLARVDAETGKLEELTHPDLRERERSHRWPQLLPGGETVIFTVDHEGSNFDEAFIEALSLRTGERRVLVKGGAYGRLLGDGHLVFGQAGRLYAQRFDPRRLAVEGRPELVLEGVHYDGRNGATHISLADDGTMVYAAGSPVPRERYLAWIDSGGTCTRLPGVARLFHDPRLDPLGQRIAVRVGSPDAAEVWIQSVASGTLSPLTSDLKPWRPLWSRDGRFIVVGSEAAGHWRLLAVPIAGGTPSTLFESENRLYPGDFSPDGRYLLYQQLDPQTGWDLSLLELDDALHPRGRAQAFATTAANEANPRFSPDGRWLAYESDELDAEAGVYVVPFGRQGARVKASQELGRWPVWSAAGQLYYWMAIPREMHRLGWRERDAVFDVRSDEVVWSGKLHRGPGGHDFDPRSGRLLFLEEQEPQSPPPFQMTLFVGFPQEVRRRLSEARH